MNSLTFYDIFIGANGYTVLFSSMLLALAAATYRKIKRFKGRSNKDPFDPKLWLRENTFDMVAGFFSTYVLVRLINFVSIAALRYFNLENAASEGLEVSEVLIVVSLFIGYYNEEILVKIFRQTK